MSAAIFVEERPVGGRQVVVTGGMVIGREGADMVVADPEVSRRHAAIRDHGGGVAIEDLDSTNGTFVNERRIEGVVMLRDGDTVRIGNTVWRLRISAAAPGAVIAEVPAPPTAVGQPAPVVNAQAIGPRGDVAAPPSEVPSAIRRVLPTPAIGQAPMFSPPGQRVTTARRGSAATRVEATIVCFVFAAVVAAALIAYFASQ